MELFLRGEKKEKEENEGRRFQFTKRRKIMAVVMVKKGGRWCLLARMK